MKHPRKIFIDLDPGKGQRAISMADSYMKVYIVQTDPENFAKTSLIIKTINLLNVKCYSSLEEVLDATDVGLIAIPETMPVSQIKPLIEKNPGVKIMFGDYLAQESGENDWLDSYRLALISRFRSQYDESYKHLEEIMEKMSPNSEHKHLVDFEKTYTCFYCDKKEMGFKAVNDYIFSPYPTWQSKVQVFDIAKYYVKPLPRLGEIDISIPLPTPFLPANPSLLKMGDEFYLNIRAVNYTVDRNNGSFNVIDGGKNMLTRNFLVKLDKNLKIKSVIEMIDRSGSVKFSYHIKGLEDIRLISPTEFFCSNLEITSSNTPQICYGKFEEDGTVKKLTHLKIANGPEKNWVPFKIDGEIHFIYSFEPFRIYKLVDEKPVLVFEKFVRPEFLDSFRGSSSPIEYKGGYLCIVHQIMYAHPRRYYHRFVWFSRDFETMKYGQMFCFEVPEVEFNMSICLHNDELLVTYSVWDNTAKLIRVSLDQIDI